MTRHTIRERLFLFIAAAMVAAAASLHAGGASAQEYEQRVLGPGLYAFQTRVRSASCGDDFPTGFVSTFVATIDGVPGARRMQMKVLNSAYWPKWELSVGADGRITGLSRVEREKREATFEVELDGERFVGRGSRSYYSTIDGQRRRCSVHVDVLLRRFDI